jgi:hypothetical protein
MNDRRLLFGSTQYRRVRWICLPVYAVFFLLGFMSPSESWGVFLLLVCSPLLVATLLSVCRAGIVLCVVVGAVPVTMLSMLVISRVVLIEAVIFPVSVAVVAFVIGGVWGIGTAAGGFILVFLGRELERWRETH